MISRNWRFFERLPKNFSKVILLVEFTRKSRQLHFRLAYQREESLRRPRYRLQTRHRETFTILHKVSAFTLHDAFTSIPSAAGAARDENSLPKTDRMRFTAGTAVYAKTRVLTAFSSGRTTAVGAAADVSGDVYPRAARRLPAPAHRRIKRAPHSPSAPRQRVRAERCGDAEREGEAASCRVAFSTRSLARSLARSFSLIMRGR